MIRTLQKTQSFRGRSFSMMQRFGRLMNVLGFGSIIAMLVGLCLLLVFVDAIAILQITRNRLIPLNLAFLMGTGAILGYCLYVLYTFPRSCLQKIW